MELFVSQRIEGYEIWLVRKIDGERLIIDHHLTHDKMETRLHYRTKGDLSWREAPPMELPPAKHANAIEMEKSIEEGAFTDLPSVFGHFGFGSLDLAPINRKVLAKAKRELPGRWSDGIVELHLGPDGQLEMTGLNKNHPLNLGRNPEAPVRNWWNFARWQLWLMNKEEKFGQHLSVLHVGPEELHLASWVPDCMAYVFRRLK